MKVWICTPHFHGDLTGDIAVFNNKKDAALWAERISVGKSVWFGVDIHKYHVRGTQ